MIFLEYLLQRFLGKADSQGSYECPRCGVAALRPKPHKKEFKDRFDCKNCGWWGDEKDLLKAAFPAEDYDKRLIRLAALQIDFALDGRVSPRKGDGEYEADVEQTFLELTQLLKGPMARKASRFYLPLRFLVLAYATCKENRVSMDDLAVRVARYLLKRPEVLKGWDDNNDDD